MLTLTQYQAQVDADDALYLRADQIVRDLFRAVEREQTRDFDKWLTLWADATGYFAPESVQENLWDDCALPRMGLDEMKSAVYDMEDALIEDLMGELA